jgi:hypothetical protein
VTDLGARFVDRDLIVIALDVGIHADGMDGYLLLRVSLMIDPLLLLLLYVSDSII